MTKDEIGRRIKVLTVVAIGLLLAFTLTFALLAKHSMEKVQTYEDKAAEGL